MDCYNFIKRVGFSELHVFPFSPREGTPAATMKNQVDGITKKDRVKRLIDLSHELWNDYISKFVGSKQTVIVETKFEDNYVIGHSSNYLKVLLPCDLSLIKHRVIVEIESKEGEYLIGRVLQDLDEGLMF